MGKLQEYLSEDSNQYGPGTDLIVSLMAVLLIVIFIYSNLFQHEQEKTKQLEKGGNFKAIDSFPAGDFKSKPYTELTDKDRTLLRIKAITDQYEAQKNSFKQIFVIGHANQIDDPHAIDKSDPARWERNWNYAGERAAVISRLLQTNLKVEDRDNLVVVSTGEFDMRNPNPKSSENAWVEVVFGTEWKPKKGAK